MAVFNKRQVGYIKAIAGVGKHKSFIHRTFNGNLAANGVQLQPSDYINATDPGLSRTAFSSDKCFEKKAQLIGFAVHRKTLAVDSSDTSQLVTSWTPSLSKSTAGLTAVSTKGTGTNGYQYEFGLLDCPMIAEGHDGLVDENGETTVTSTNLDGQNTFTPTDFRVGTECFVDKTTMKLRFTMPDFGLESSNLKPHFEYRFIVFRNRKATATNTAEETQRQVSYLNFQYDLFNGPVGRPIGFRGHRRRQDFDGDEEYRGLIAYGSDWTRSNATAVAETGAADDNLTIDEWMTMPLNKADYVVMRDERFFLGMEHGKSHYETMLTFDWNQRSDTIEDDLAQGFDDGFNPNWNILILGTSNDGLQPDLNINISATTSIESS